MSPSRRRRIRRRRKLRLEGLEDRRLLAVFNVNSTVDSVDANPGDGIAADSQGRATLRAAIMEANALLGADTINLPAGTYQLTVNGRDEDFAQRGDLDVRGDLEIIGAGAEATVIDASTLSSRDRVFHLHRGTFSDRYVIGFEGVTITGGIASSDSGPGFEDYGGGIFVDFYTDVSIVDSIVRNNEAPRRASNLIYGLGGAISNSGNLEIIRSRFEQNLATNSGGAIYMGGSGASLVIRESTFDSNTSAGGGAILGRYETLIENSTFTNNVAESASGSGAGGAIQVQGSTAPLRINNSTFSGNRSPSGGAIQTFSTVQINHSTFTGNDSERGPGAINASSSSASVSLQNTIVAGNTGRADYPEVRGDVTSLGYNLIGNPTGSTGWIATDQQNVAANLGPLADNGGPTQTHALLPGSLALNAANPASALLRDQRGIVRPQGGRSDIGAFELESSDNTPPVAADDSYRVEEDGALIVTTSGLPGSPPVLHYNFDESDSGNSDALDLGARPGANGTFVGQATRVGDTPSDATTGALDLTAGQDAMNYVSDGDADKIDELTQFTATFWMNLQADPSDGDVLLGDVIAVPPFPETATSGWQLGITTPAGQSAPTKDNFRLEFRTSRIGTSVANSQGSYSNAMSADGEWLFVAMTLSESGLFRLYTGGEATATTSDRATQFAAQYLPTGQDNPSELRVGGSSRDADNTPPAWIDDVRIYDRVLSSSQVEIVRQLGVEPSLPTVLDNDSDPDGDPLQAVLEEGPANGSLTLNQAGTFTYVPNDDFNGVDEFTYRASDGTAVSDIATVTITVTAVNDGPDAVDDSDETDAGVAVDIPVLDNDSDADGDPIRILNIESPGDGTAVENPDGTIKYTPRAGFVGDDTFVYSITDDNGEQDSATVTVTVKPINTPPVAVDDSYSVQENGVLQVRDRFGSTTLDQQSDEGGFKFATNHFHMQQQVRAGAAGRLESIDLYSSADTHVGAVLTVGISRGGPWHNGPAEYTTQITITQGMLGGRIDVDLRQANFELEEGELFTIFTSGGNVSPGQSLYLILSRQENVGDSYPEGQVWIEGSPYEPFDSGYDFRFRTYIQPLIREGVLVNDTDVDGDPLTANRIMATANGSVSLEPNGNFVYTPNRGFSGVDEFTYQAHDGQAASNTATVTITVDPLPRPVVERVMINDGSMDRSQLKSLTVDFSTAVDHEQLQEAFSVFHHEMESDVGIVHVEATTPRAGKTSAVLTFDGSLTESGDESDSGGSSLIDGNYSLTVDATKVVSLAGHAMVADHVYSGGGPNNDDFFRMYGDTDGDRDVDGVNYTRFAETFLRRLGDSRFDAAFDFDDDNDVDGLDYTEFVTRFLRSLAPPS